VALLADDKILASLSLLTAQTHSQRLMPAIDSLFKQLDLSPADLDAIAVSIGPGSFTGIRISMSTAKGLALASAKPLIGIATLEALANRHRDPRAAQNCAIIDAKRGEVFAQIFKFDPDSAFASPASEPSVLTPEKLLDKISQPTLLLGNGALRYRELLQNSLGENATFAPPTRIMPSADEVALLALHRLQQGQTDEPMSLEPIYLRKSDAELKRKS
jgi:tRNA threonylcarbamoyladenosine biosynthesis protein TsaB